MKKIAYKAEISNLPVFMEFVTAFAEETGMSPGNIQKIELALEEALVNIIHYAYPTDSPDKIEVQCSKTDQGITIILLDTGAPFNPLLKEDPDTSSSIEDKPIGGLGIFLVKQMMDDTNYKREANKNILTLIKHN